MWWRKAGYHLSPQPRHRSPSRHLDAPIAGASEFGSSLIEELLDARYAALKPTILIGNITRAQFEQRYGGVFADRLNGGIGVELIGKSMRGK
jgi:hypothetical protein